MNFKILLFVALAAVGQSICCDGSQDDKIRAFGSIYFGMSKNEVELLSIGKQKIDNIEYAVSYFYVPIAGVSVLSSTTLTNQEFNVLSDQGLIRKLSAVIKLMDATYGKGELNPKSISTAGNGYTDLPNDGLGTLICTWREKEGRLVRLYYSEEYKFTGNESLAKDITRKLKGENIGILYDYTYWITIELPLIESRSLEEKTKFLK